MDPIAKWLRRPGGKQEVTRVVLLCENNEKHGGVPMYFKLLSVIFEVVVTVFSEEKK